MSKLNYFRVFRRHAALLVVAIGELWPAAPARNKLRAFDRSRDMSRKPTALTLLAPCLTTKYIRNIVQLTHETPRYRS
jgi:hypothetical protein